MTPTSTASRIRFKTAASPAMPEPLKLVWLLAAIAALTALVLTGTAPERVPGSRYILAFAARGALISIPLVVLALICRRFIRVPVARLALTGLCLGLFLNAALTTLLTLRFDAPILDASRKLREQTGIITIGEASFFESRPGVWNRRDPLGEVPSIAAHILCAAEDERCFDRKVTPDPWALARAVRASIQAKMMGKGIVQGGSDLPEQVASLLLGLKPEGTGWQAMRTKIVKSLVAFRIDDRFSRDDQIWLYLQTAPFGSVNGSEAVGLASAAHVFYGCEPDSLTAMQLAELMARLRNPSLFQPYVAKNLDRHRARTEAILDVAVRKGWLTGEHTDGEFLAGIATRKAAGDALRIPHETAVLDEIAGLVPDAAARHLLVELSYDPRLQRALVEAVRDELSVIDSRLAWRNHKGDSVEIDVSVVTSDGGAVAEYGLAAEPSDGGSIYKVENYGLALERGTLRSIESAVPGTRMVASQALIRSKNEMALAMARATGIKRLADHLRAQGYTVNGDHESIVLGAGVSGSPRQVAGNFLKFGYKQPGYRVRPSVVARVVDAQSGAVLHEPDVLSVFSERTALQVRSALEQVSTKGTASSQLRELALASPIASKTGTAGFFKRGKWQGPGGSWCVSADKATGLAVAIRTRWKSNRPFELEGGQSSAIAMRKFLRAARVLNIKGENHK